MMFKKQDIVQFIAAIAFSLIALILCLTVLPPEIQLMEGGKVKSNLFLVLLAALPLPVTLLVAVSEKNRMLSWITLFSVEASDGICGSGEGELQELEEDHAHDSDRYPLYFVSHGAVGFELQVLRFKSNADHAGSHYRAELLGIGPCNLVCICECEDECKDE